jgi:hypothetical protein
MTTPKGYLFRAIIILAAAPSQRSGWSPKSEWLKRDAIDGQSGDQKLFIAVEVGRPLHHFRRDDEKALIWCDLSQRTRTPCLDPRVKLSLNGTAFGATGLTLVAVARVEIENN